MLGRCNKRGPYHKQASSDTDMTDHEHVPHFTKFMKKIRGQQIWGCALLRERNIPAVPIQKQKQKIRRDLSSALPWLLVSTSCLACASPRPRRSSWFMAWEKTSEWTEERDVTSGLRPPSRQTLSRTRQGQVTKWRDKLTIKERFGWVKIIHSYS